MSDVMNLAAGAAAALDRLPRTTFEVPETARTETDPHTVTIRQLTFAEEKAALEAKEHGGGSFEMEGAKRALCAVDGNPLSWTDNQIENVFSGLSNKVRDMVVRGFVRVALPSKVEADAFLASGKTTA
jgi:hypothetical protein